MGGCNTTPPEPAKLNKTESGVIKVAPVQASSDYDHLFKVLIIGDSAAGKSAILHRFCEDKFDPMFISTIGIDYKFKLIEAEGKVCRLEIWDTAGQERFHTITSTYYRGAHGIIIIYSVTEKSSFNSIERWLGEIEQYTGHPVPVLVVGNKIDLTEEREVTTKEGKAMAAHHNLEFFETSAKEGTNVSEMFLRMTEIMKKHVEDLEKEKN